MRALDALVVLVRQTLTVFAALGICAVAAAGGVTLARAAVLRAAAVLAPLAALATARLREARRRALDLILEGRELLPLPAVERERRRLLRRRTRARLTAGVTGVLEEALMQPRAPVASRSLLVSGTVVRQNASDLLAVAAFVRAPATSAGGVALVERLLTDGGSALYGTEVGALREGLRRARYLLQSRSGTAGP